MVVDATAKVVVTATITGNVVVSHVHNLEPLIVFDFQRLGMVGLFNPELRVCACFGVCIVCFFLQCFRT